ncbi:formyltetrahydrofolate deformylase [Nonomuraea diastatica]|uniref:Formyltetrahydrofolate deformylase n=1 Tax=Nonomuraea diastatica TaxID=1848329 RepID=A0A4R4V701_9ACTN|nr:formyltetrahydrofolate deformylase [Nonomuraea diastatica]TDD01009.1 formyltetrahydrofolate deformylase [Nonomuraea diastatica]
MSEEYVLTFACPDRAGVVHAISGFLLRHGGNILQSQQHGDAASNRLFMRVHFSAPGDLAELRADFAPTAESLLMQWRLADAAARPRLLIMVSKYGHCLNDLLFRRRIGELPADIPLVVSNHPDLADLVTSHGIRFEHVPVTPDTKQDAEDRLLALVEEHRIDLVVLARYMQILGDDVCKQLDGRAINIHHSFLPSFKGAGPYRQAHVRGVKLIGATAHYVTADLDEGPIIEQEVVRVDHTFCPDRLAAAGRDVECLALARAVQWHIQHRLLLNGNRVVVFR